MPDRQPSVLDEPALLVLVGPAGAGKSRVARALPGHRLELDAIRALVSGCGGDQSATGAAVTVFDLALEGCLSRHRQVVVDATSTEPRIRAGLLARARTHQVPAVAIVVRTPLAACQARQHNRPAARQVPAGVVAVQHAHTPTTGRLLAEGFTHAFYADDLDLMRRMLRHSAAAGPDLLADVRRDFGDDLAAVFTRHPTTAADFTSGTFAVAGQELDIRWNDDGDPYDHHWQALVPCPEGCPGPAWNRVTGPGGLLAVHQGHPLDDEARCDRCDDRPGHGRTEG
ncbi:AAA family ATPase (plasmid) [Streptomyces uncialis]|uniref:AAA family ATPase n=1 Tax=Streptomyces uncialis TaxID=1048205 RepID=UPI002E3511B3|nr:AAA family ATPase [Streptomyces uncialis]